MSNNNYYDYDEESRLEKDHEKRGLFAFLDILIRKFLPLMNINFLYLVFSLPYILFLFWFSPLNAGSVSAMSPQIAAAFEAFSPRTAVLTDMILRFIFAVLILVLWGSGPASAGIAYILRNYSRNEFAWVWADFIGTIRENLKQSFAVLAIDIIALFLFSIMVSFYASMASGAMLVFMMIAIGFFFVMFTLMHFYIYQFMVTYENTLKQIYKNALMFALIKLIPNLLIFVVISGLILALFYYCQLFALVPLVLILTIVLELGIHFYCSRAMGKLLNK